MWIAESYAKINLGLHVLERLPTGYHRIETGFCFIEWKDRFEVSRAENYSLEISGQELPAGETNLISRAYDTFSTYVGLKNAWRFRVMKNIPAGAGLGGGSSNAALTLRILNKLESAGLEPDELIDLSRPLGADIAFFLKGMPGLGSGLGQEIEPLDIQPKLWILTVFPGFESPTAGAYAECIPDPDPEFPLKKILTEEPPEEWRFLLQNDLEAVVIRHREMIGNIKDQLYESGAEYASMSGSGSSVFGLFGQDFVALEAYRTFQDLGFSVNMTRPDFRPDYGIWLRE